jgi:hypothetical protein
VPDMPQSGWPPGFRQGAVAGHPPGHRLRRSVPPADTRAVAGRLTDMADLLTVRSAGHPQFDVTAQPMGLDPVRTVTAKRRTPPTPSRLAIRPRQSTRPARPGPDRTARQCACSFGQPAATSRDPPVMTTCTHARCRNVRKPGPRPISARSCPASTMDATIGQVSDTACPVASGRTPSTPPGTPPEPKRRGQGTDERHGRHSDITDRHDHEDSLPGRRTPPLGPALRLGNQDRLGDGNTASATVTTSVTRQLLGVAPSPRPRLGALLSSDDFGSSVERTATLHPLRQGRLWWDSKQWRQHVE